MLTVLTQKTSPFDSFTLSDRRDNRRAAIDQPRRGANGGLLGRSEAAVITGVVLFEQQRASTPSIH
jgi:hypothetical protein